MATHHPDVPGQGRAAATGPALSSGGESEPPGPPRARASARRLAGRMFQPPPRPSTVHPALIPGIGVERTHYEFSTNRAVYVVSGLFILGVIAWAIVAPDGITTLGNLSLDWVIVHFGWLFGMLALAVFGFMMVLGYGPAGGVRLGADDEQPEFSTFSWVAMLFSAGMGIGLLFYGPYEPLAYFANPPPGFDVAAGTVEASQVALAQTALHWGPIAWAFYAMVGGAIAYNAYRRGRAPLISAIFEPLLGDRVNGPAGSIIDIFAIIVTLFGTAISLGIGALQIAAGTEAVTGIARLGNGFIVVTMAVLTCAFIVSAVSGVTRGIRVLSNTNMIVTGLLALLVLVTGPTLYLFNFYPAAILSFFKELGTMLVRNANEGEATARFMASWTTYYWAWWITWAPFVGLFIAKISRGRTLREFVTVVVMVPAMVCVTWFVIFGGASMYMAMHGMSVSAAQDAEALLFSVLRNLPLAGFTPYLAMFSILVFFVTSADSASIVMSSMTQRGQPEPSIGVTISWGLLLGLTAISLLLAGGENALSGLQSIMVVTALPFALVLIGLMAAWSRDLYTDPYLLRRKYARAAIAQGVRLGIANHGDDFVFGSSAVAKDEGAGGWIDSDDPALVAWYVDAAEEGEIVSAEDVRRTLSPGRIQPRGPLRPDLTASGDEATATGRTRRALRRRARSDAPRAPADKG